MKKQDFDDVDVPWTQDWKKYLADNGFPPIVTAHASCEDTRISVDATTVTDEGTSVTFSVSQSGLTRSLVVPIEVHVRLENGVELDRTFELLFTNVTSAV